MPRSLTEEKTCVVVSGVRYTARSLSLSALGTIRSACPTLLFVVVVVVAVAVAVAVAVVVGPWSQEAPITLESKSTSQHN